MPPGCGSAYVIENKPGGQPAAYEQLLEAIPTRVDQILTRLQSLAGIAQAMRHGELDHGLVTGEARFYLDQLPEARDDNR